MQVYDRGKNNEFLSAAKLLILSDQCLLGINVSSILYIVNTYI